MFGIFLIISLWAFMVSALLHFIVRMMLKKRDGE